MHFKSAAFTIINNPKNLFSLPFCFRKLHEKTSGNKKKRRDEYLSEHWAKELQTVKGLFTLLFLCFLPYHLKKFLRRISTVNCWLFSFVTHRRKKINFKGTVKVWVKKNECQSESSAFNLSAKHSGTTIHTKSIQSRWVQKTRRK